MAFSRDAASLRSPLAVSPGRPSRFLRLLVGRTKRRRPAPCSARTRATWVPRNPVAPVMKAFTTVLNQFFLMPQDRLSDNNLAPIAITASGDGQRLKAHSSLATSVMPGHTPDTNRTRAGGLPSPSRAKARIFNWHLARLGIWLGRSRALPKPSYKTCPKWTLVLRFLHHLGIRRESEQWEVLAIEVILQVEHAREAGAGEKVFVPGAVFLLSA